MQVENLRYGRVKLSATCSLLVRYGLTAVPSFRRVGSQFPGDSGKGYFFVASLKYDNKLFALYLSGMK